MLVQVWTLMISWIKGNPSQVDRMFNNNSSYEDSCNKLITTIRFPSIAKVNSTLDQKSMLVLQDIFKQQVLDAFLKCYIKQVDIATRFRQGGAMFEALRSSESIPPQLKLRNPQQVLMAVGGVSVYDKKAASPVVSTVSMDELTESAASPGSVIVSYGVNAARIAQSKAVEFTTRLQNCMNTPLCEHAMCVVDGVLFVAGGQERYDKYDEEAVNSLHRFDPRSGIWSQVSTLRFSPKL